MKGKIVQFFAVLFCTFAISLPAWAATTYTMDTSHSYVQWHINHFGFSTQSGKWYVEKGTLSLDQADPQNSKVSATIDINSLATGLTELDKHLKSPLFFDAAKYATATFVSNKIEVTGKNTANVYGTLTLHGVSKPVVLNTILNKADVNPISNKNTVGFSATTTINRSDFGMTTLLPGLGDSVAINIEVEAYQTPEA